MATPAPDGITQEHESNSRRANPWPLVLLTVILGAGLTGLFAGQAPVVRKTSNDRITLVVQTPETLRNGMVFETIVEVTPRKPVGELVIAVSDDLWREMTINTMIPAASEERYKGGSRQFSFGEAKPGETFRFKIDGQINPPLFAGTRGKIAALDGERELAALPVHIKVLP
ncbi:MULTISPECIES: hypothetical protein [Sphingobium]|uniref:hypothetical protein n=1 Tax=Sphingobium TaxID=165695 RepID=UPI0015EC8E5F|nr:MULTISPECIES: hypothetical protein [Sphingobium]MCW2361903.1 hypothetical protein [Sphingobium sp. B10D3B]MCW2401418.1 hypothetical protein [Sphingobium sp. B10D7B]MCW2408398.1 hypothetical protein [Sphingobium xanthum]